LNNDRHDEVLPMVEAVALGAHDLAVEAFYHAVDYRTVDEGKNLIEMHQVQDATELLAADRN
jgi:hypothetical protein